MREAIIKVLPPFCNNYRDQISFGGYGLACMAGTIVVPEGYGLACMAGTIVVPEGYGLACMAGAIVVASLIACMMIPFCVVTVATQVDLI